MFNPYGGGWPPSYPPQQPVIFIPSPAAVPPNLTASDIANQISNWKSIEKLFKEEKKDDGKKKEQPNVLAVMLLMLLIAPVTGPIMAKFFSVGLSYLH